MILGTLAENASIFRVFLGCRKSTSFPGLQCEDEARHEVGRDTMLVKLQYKITTNYRSGSGTLFVFSL